MAVQGLYTPINACTNSVQVLALLFKCVQPFKWLKAPSISQCGNTLEAILVWSWVLAVLICYLWQDTAYQGLAGAANLCYIPICIVTGLG